jgi:hypothetical protein
MSLHSMDVAELPDVVLALVTSQSARSQEMLIQT